MSAPCFCGKGLHVDWHNTILIGIAACGCKIRADGDILFATPNNELLFSEGVVYLNGERQCTTEESGVEAIREALLSVAGNLKNQKEAPQAPQVADA